MKVLVFLLMVFSLVLAEECKVYEGYASWYGKRFHGRKTSSGEIFNKYKYTAAFERSMILLFLNGPLSVTITTTSHLR